ncbi:restriction endonuclease subunit S [Clostridium sp. SHJSY1]|uniref:restriction endonuclease subunit S n=1 Tax=Clostridium sp. SHJSY1 TaxID=2942483 RepID=UPI00287598A7|nr:restriction endonuclease subunit S [Clostridium sp. SHJSY1]MDS0526074.1 restriction endonuclease subunit S [Clostridium sp. SHJSY1]
MNAQDLKNSILQLAIQGKLVEQRQEEGTAKELIEEIKAEKERLIKEKKIKKEKTLAEITEDEVPFEIPGSWEWVRFNDAVLYSTDYVANGSFASLRNNVKTYKEKNYALLVKTQDFSNGFSYDLTYVDETSYDFLKKSRLFGGELMLSNIGASIGKAFIIPILDIPMTLAPNSIMVKCLDNIMTNFIRYIILSFYGQKLLNEFTSGTAMPKFSKTQLRNCILPIPPYEEQKRIVGKIEELIPYIEKYGKAYSKLEIFNKKFPEDMQKSILQYAIQGKLVEQREEDGTAEELYKQIQEEKEKLIKEKKIKKEKPLTEITEDEVAFEIPGSWKWVRFGDVINLLSGQDFQPDQYNDQYKGIPYITGASSLSDEGVIVSRWTETPRCLANSGDILLVCKGSGYGKTVTCDIEEAHIARQIMAIKYFEFMNMSYIKWFLKANVSLIKEKGQGVIPGIDRKSVQNMLFPLPPLAEQKRIVAKIEEMLPYCQQLVK